jgi:acetyl esterase/lipase
VGVVICPGGGYRDVWLDREGHDLAIWLKDYGITSLVLKYRTNASREGSRMAYSWQDYLPAVQADARQAIRILRIRATELGLQTNKIGICGFSAGGNLALLTTLYAESKQPHSPVSSMPDFTGLFYPWFRDDYREDVARRAAPESPIRPIGPVFMMNAQDDRVTPSDKCVEFYQSLLAADVTCELHIYTKGSHGFDLGAGRGESTAMWPASFIAFLRDVGVIADDQARD